MSGLTPILSCVAVGVAGGIGAAARYALDGAILSRTGRDGLPWGTITINVTGSFLLGLATGMVTALALSPTWHSVLGAGFLGGYTTFSTASFETVALLREGRYRLALVNGVGVLMAATCAAAGGLWLGAQW